MLKYLCKKRINYKGHRKRNCTKRLWIYLTDYLSHCSPGYIIVSSTLINNKIMYHYRSAYIQKGHGLGGLLRGIRKLFTPLARKVVTSLNKPEVKIVLQTLGNETVSMGSEVLPDSLGWNDIQATLDRRINKATK